MRKTLKKYYKKTQEYVWKVGFVQNSLDEILDGAPLNVKWVSGEPPGVWWADPFILDANERELVLLVEEFPFATRRGTIVRLTIDRATLQVIHRAVVLSLDTHLSFPAIYRSSNGNIYVYPENWKSGSLKVWRYDTDAQKLTEPHVLCPLPLTDAIFTSLLGFPMLASTRKPSASSPRLDFYCPSFADGGLQWVESEMVFCGSHLFDRRVARSAGDWFEYRGKIYRPAMESEIEYGHAVVLQEVSVEQVSAPASANAFPRLLFKDVRTLLSPDSEYERGLHTFNVYKDTIVIDVKGYRYPVFGRLMRKIRNLMG